MILKGSGKALQAGQGKSTSPFLSAKERIEAIPDVAKYEVGFLRAKPGELRQSEKMGERHCRADLPRAGDRTAIHTHVLGTRKEAPYFFSFPGLGDMHCAYIQAISTNVRCWHIASINQEGKVMGYFSYVFTPKFYSKAATDEYYLIRLIAKHLIFGNSTKEEVFREFESEGLIRGRAMPMPGYSFNRERGAFEKKPGQAGM